MNQLARFRRELLGLLALLVAAAPVLTRQEAAVAGMFRLDALGMLFVVALAGGVLLALAEGAQVGGWRGWALAGLAALALGTSATPLVALAVAGFGLLALPAAGWRGRVAPLALLGGYGLLAARGAWLYDSRGAGAALDSLVFWLVLVSAALQLLELVRSANRAGLAAATLGIYPLARLYTLGPWNAGWSLAAALLGGAAVLWFGWRGFRLRAPLAGSGVCLGAALGCFGLATSAGIAAGGYALLAAAVCAGAPARGWWNVARWLAGLVACWMALGAAVGAGLIALAGVFWLGALLAGLGLVLPGGTGEAPGAGPTPAALAGLALAVGAPLVLFWLGEPAVLLVQGGLTPYGDVRIWPWVGVAFVSSAQTQVAVLPSVAVAALLGVLVALLVLLGQLRARAAETVATGEQTGDLGWFWQVLREELPWFSRGHDDAA